MPGIWGSCSCWGPQVLLGRDSGVWNRKSQPAFSRPRKMCAGDAAGTGSDPSLEKKGQGWGWGSPWPRTLEQAVSYPPPWAACLGAEHARGRLSEVSGTPALSQRPPVGVLCLGPRGTWSWLQGADSAKLSRGGSGSDGCHPARSAGLPMLSLAGVNAVHSVVNPFYRWPSRGAGSLSCLLGAHG